MTAYYNDNDPAACAVLSMLIELDVIPFGVIDPRPIEKIQWSEIAGFTQYHFFAGGGLWAVAARMAGWADDRPIWTASCPCQPYSQAGRRRGDNDSRNLWPHLFRIVRSARQAGRRPSCIVGEQVAGKAGYNWFNGVRLDLASEGIGARCVDFPACAVNAPHQRNRLHWIALAGSESIDGGRHVSFWRPEGRTVIGRSDASMVNGQSDGWQQRRTEWSERLGTRAVGNSNAQIGAMDSAEPTGLERFNGYDGRSGRPSERAITDRSFTASDDPSDNYWSNTEWIICHDGKARRTKPGVCFLVDGLPGRVDLWRIAGNAVVPQAEAEVIKALMDVLDGEV